MRTAVQAAAKNGHVTIVHIYLNAEQMSTPVMPKEEQLLHVLLTKITSS